MIINVIHDDRRPERMVDFKAEIARQGHSILYQVWPATVLVDSVVKSINASHKKIVQYAKNVGLPEVCIAEDDLWFPAKDGWEFFLKNKPKYFDIYLGGSYIVDQSGFMEICGFQLYIVNSGFYDKFLSAPDDVHIDSHFNYVEGNYKFCQPFAALQRPAFSANCNAFVDYNNVISKELIYYGHNS